MSSKLNRQTYEKLIEEDIAALPADMPNLERGHIVAVLRESVAMHYETVPSLESRLDEMRKALSLIADPEAELTERDAQGVARACLAVAAAHKAIAGEAPETASKSRLKRLAVQRGSDGEVPHRPNCAYWRWDWRHSWHDSDCTCGVTAGEEHGQIDKRNIICPMCREANNYDAQACVNCGVGLQLSS